MKKKKEEAEGVSINDTPEPIIWMNELKMKKIHASETAWVGTNFDIIVDNNGTIDDLYKQAGLIVSN